MRKNRVETQITGVKNEREDITTWPTNIKIMVRQDYSHLYASKCHSLYKMDTFLEINCQSSLKKKRQPK